MRKRLALVKFGFTLIELLVVISLIGLLSTLVLANFNSGRERSRDAQRKSDLRSIQTAFRMYYNDKGSYPAVFPTGGSPWTVGGTTYMNSFPKDPLPAQSYRYTYTDGDNYTIDCCLENKSDDKGVTTTNTTWCPSGWMYQVKS